MKAVFVSGTHSGCGKTVAALLVMKALAERGYTVQGFKVGPDYIDPSFHEAVSGRKRRNLDWWMMGEDGIRDNFVRGVEGADVAVVEGVMGHFDGLFREGLSSTHHVSSILDFPVILVVDAWGMLQSLEAVLKGYVELSGGRIKGVILNSVGSSKHGLYLERIAKGMGLRVCGVIKRVPDLRLPERHLGLFLPDEASDFLDAVSHLSGEFIDVDEILSVSAELDIGVVSKWKAEDRIRANSVKNVTVFYDEAFSFLYSESLEALEFAGCKVRFISPTRGDDLPSETELLIIPGGYPELHASSISSNTRLMQSVREFSRDLPIYAECGGLMFLSEEVVFRGRSWKMAGIFPVKVGFGNSPVLGYATGVATENHPFLSPGKEVRGHIFHYSRMEERAPILPAYDLLFPEEKDSIQEGLVRGKTVATYLHTNLMYSPGILKGLLGM